MSPITPRLFVGYCRVSTERQARSGLGLEAQEAAIRAYLGQNGGRLLAPLHVETESGKLGTNRPELAKAMARCRSTGATLLIAKLDRLSRDAHFLLGLEKAGVEFVAADMPHANRLTVRLMAVIADEERHMIAARTKAALTAAKARGKALGGLRQGQRLPTKEAAQRGAERAAGARREAADHAAHRVAACIQEARAAGATSLHAIAARLTERNVPTPRGGSAWTATGVRRALARLPEEAVG